MTLYNTGKSFVNFKYHKGTSGLLSILRKYILVEYLIKSQNILNATNKFSKLFFLFGRSRIQVDYFNIIQYLTIFEGGSRSKIFAFFNFFPKNHFLSFKIRKKCSNFGVINWCNKF